MSKAVAIERPWELPFWKPVAGKRVIFFYLALIHALAVAGVILFPTPDLKVLAATLAITVLGGLGTTVCYHRSLSHGTLKLHPVIEYFLTFFTMFNGSGNPASWVAYHRHHHANSDQPEDISSPKHGGFWWAHIRWLYQSEQADAKRWCPEFTRGVYKFWSKSETYVIAASIFCGLMFGWEGFFWMGAIRLVYSLHMQCFVNSLTHLGHEHDDTSQNVWWLGPLQLGAWGENWHRNHHANAASARLGLKWYQIDVGWYFIWMLEKVGLAKRVLRPKVVQVQQQETAPA